ncbi:uncharacterized protein LOC132933261 [Metopolophium dirhodum]|uniref:uncharacterized protein LOC132933261 n=1 Tax=Metopolophium dirhodum TaxID=44670 RepID=UPI002990024C|nr:uncharacterized protein LOC132933261 [Metopolophium dirhodum]
MAYKLNDGDKVDCLFDSDAVISDLPSENNSFVDDSDVDPDFLLSPSSNTHNDLLVHNYEYNVFEDPQWDTNTEIFINPVFLSDSNLAPHMLLLEFKTPYNLFLDKFPDSLVDIILFQTNLCAQQAQQLYTPATKQELKTFLGLNILMGIKRLPSYRDYWSTEPDLNDPFISKQMTVNRFGWFLFNLHCNDKSLEPKRGSPSFDKLYKLRTVIEKLSECFLKGKNLTQNLTIDDSMVKQFIKTKQHCFGIEVFVLCETDFILDIIIYTGSITEYKKTDPSLGISGAVVNTLLKPYLNRGHKLFIDNWYSSPCLAKCLHKKKSNVTVRKNRKGMLSLLAKLKVGQTESQHTKNMLVVKWKDRRDAHYLV